MSNATPVLVDPKHVTLHRLAGAFLAGYQSPATRRAYTAGLRRWFAWCDHHDQDPLEATRVAIDLWLVDLEKCGLAASSRGTMLTPLRAWYRWLVDEGHMQADPTVRIRTPRPEDNAQPALTRNQISVLLAHAQKVGGISPAMVGLLFVNGLRVSELCAADVTDLSWSAHHRILTVQGKGAKVVDVPLPPVVVYAIEEHLEGRELGPLLLNAAGGRLTRFSVRDRLATLCRQAGVPVVSPHALRRTGIQLQLADGVPLRTVQAWARHADPKTTARYDDRQRGLDEHTAYAMMRIIA